MKYLFLISCDQKMIENKGVTDGYSLLMIYLSEQLTFLHQLQQLRNPILDSFFFYLNFFDFDFFAILLVLFVWFCCSAKWGVRLGFLLIANGVVNYLAKMALSLPRPCEFDPTLARVAISTEFGCPSGKAQMSFLLSCLLIYFWKSRFAWPLGLFYALCIAVSRLFLGVHFPLDVVGGWGLAILLFFFFIQSVESIERLASAHSLPTFLITLAIAAIFSVLFSYPAINHLMSLTAAMAATVYLKSLLARRKVFMNL